MIFGHVDIRRFDALAGYARHPRIRLITQEIGWYSDATERVLGVLALDLIDRDFSFVVFGRDEAERFRAVDAGVSHPTPEEAQEKLFDAMQAAAEAGLAAFHQGDVEFEPIDFFAPLIKKERRHPSFEILCNDARFSPARELIQVMMRWHEDLDGVFVKNLQSGGFDARIWELYIWATFVELGFTRDLNAQVPDFIFRGLDGALAIEATSINAPDGEDGPKPADDPGAYLENYVPIKLSRALGKKLNHKPPYWQADEVKDLPFCIAVQDFHMRAAMRFIVTAATEYVFGVRHSIEDGKHVIAEIGVHKFGKMSAKSGFFKRDGAENVSAIILNPQGTLTKFNRLGFVAGFGDPRVRMVRTGLKRNDGNQASPLPSAFEQKVDANYHENWVEGMVVLHNPNARIPLDPRLIPGAAHEFLQPDGSIQTLLPDFHPFTSQTTVAFGDEETAIDE